MQRKTQFVFSISLPGPERQRNGPASISVRVPAGYEAPAAAVGCVVNSGFHHYILLCGISAQPLKKHGSQKQRCRN